MKMNYFVPPILAYLIVCIICTTLPASEGYNSVGWKLFIGQIYAIPMLIIVSIIMFILKKKTPEAKKRMDC